jgi:hypothetical protein
LPISSAATRLMIFLSYCVFLSAWPPRTSGTASARRNRGHCWRNLILVLEATMNGP